MRRLLDALRAFITRTPLPPDSVSPDEQSSLAVKQSKSEIIEAEYDRLSKEHVRLKLERDRLLKEKEESKYKTTKLEHSDSNDYSTTEKLIEKNQASDAPTVKLETEPEIVDASKNDWDLKTENGESLTVGISDVPITTEQAPKTDHYIEGSITDRETNVALEGATITMLNVNTNVEDKILSNSDGRFEHKLPIGEYDVTISCDGYFPVTRRRSITPQQGCYVDFGSLQRNPKEAMSQQDSIPDAIRFSDFQVVAKTREAITIRFSYIYNGSYGDVCWVNVTPLKRSGSPIFVGHSGGDALIANVRTTMELEVYLPAGKKRRDTARIKLSVECPGKADFGHTEFEYPKSQRSSKEPQPPATTPESESNLPNITETSASALTLKPEESRNNDADTKPQDEQKKPFDFIDKLTAALCIIGAVLASAFGSDGLHFPMVLTVFLTICVALFDIFRRSSNKRRWYGFACLVLVAFVACAIWEMQHQRQRTKANTQDREGGSVDTPAVISSTPQNAQSQEQPPVTESSNQNRSPVAENSAQPKQQDAPQSPGDKPAPDDTLFLTENGVAVVAGPTENKLNGVVRDSETGNAIEGAKLTIENLDTKETRSADSNAEGYFDEPLPFGQYKVTLIYPGYRLEERRCTITKKRGCYLLFDRLKKVTSSDSPNSTRDAISFSGSRIVGQTDKTITIRVSYVYDGSFGKEGCFVIPAAFNKDGSRIHADWSGDSTLAATGVRASMELDVNIPAGKEREQLSKFKLIVECPGKPQFGFAEIGYVKH
jgi:Carboxypeptidase regulatory-like domain